MLDTIEKRVLTSGSIARQTDVKTLEEQLCYGSVILFIDGLAKALVLDAKGWEGRAQCCQVKKASSLTFIP